MLFIFNPTTAELADANNKLCTANNVTVKKTEDVLAAVYSIEEPEFKVENTITVNDKPCLASDAHTEKTEVTHTAVYKYNMPNIKVEGATAANNAIVEKTEALLTAVYNFEEPGLKIEKATAANDKLYMASNKISEKTDATPTAVNNTKKPGFKFEKATEAQKHYVNLRKVAPPLTHIKGGMYGNTNDKFQRYDNYAEYYNGFTYNLDDELKRCGELVPNYYEFAIF
ncbi:hypothetical protein GGH96_000001 [Coemansia sp. RSA 1972]|nr:hypothetical protein GGH96_000001 [Coemansia sp. RSA 1972]